MGESEEFNVVPDQVVVTNKDAGITTGKVTFKNVMEKQLREENITKEVVKIIKNNPSLVRDTVEKRCSHVTDQ